MKGLSNINVKAREASAAQRISRLFSIVAPGAWDWDVASNIFTVTERLRQIFGFPPNMMVEMNSVIAATHPDDRGWTTAILEPAVSPANFPLVGRFRIYRYDTGEMKWISSRIWHDEESGDAGTSAYSGIVIDVTEEIATAAALAQSEQRLRLAIEAGKMAVWEVDLETSTLTQSTELNLLFGYPADAFMTLEMARACYNAGEIERLATERHTAEAVRTRAVEGDFEPWHADALKSGDDRTQVQAEVAITTRTGQPKRLMLRAQYAVSPEGRPRLTGLLFDITETKMAEERIAVVARELQHRVKNSLSVIGAIATQSWRTKTDVEAGLRNFLGRLSALSAANDLILSGDSGRISLHDIIEKITQPYYTGTYAPFVIEGPAVHLQPRAATATGMVLHELCTNAIKYGALSVAGGQVSIEWISITPDLIRLTWHERNGPPVTEPQRPGFGFRLLDNVIKSDLKGTLVRDFTPAGLLCRIEIPINR